VTSNVFNIAGNPHRDACHVVFGAYLIIHEFARGQRHRIDFRVIKITGQAVAEKNPAIHQLFPPSRQSQSTKDDTGSNLFLSGYIKVDGESHWDFGAAAQRMILLQKRDERDGLDRLLARMYQIAVEQIPSFTDGVCELPPQPQPLEGP